MKLRLILLFCPPLLLTGCVETLILDELQFIHSVGYDYIDEDRVEGTASVPIYKMEEQVGSETISAVASTSRDIRLELNARSSKPLHSGKISSILFSEEMAQKMGIMQILDSFSRDSAVGMRNFICITRDSPKKMLELSSPLEIDIAVYIKELIEQNIERQNIPQSNFHLFLKRYYEDGQDPFLPYLSLKGNTIQIEGVSLFQGDRYVGKLNLKEAFMMKILLEPFANGTYEVSLPEEGEYAVLRNIHSKAHYHIERNTNTPAIKIVINFTGKLNEYSGEKLNEQKLTEIVETLKQQLENDIVATIGLFQEKNIDPLGIGSRVKARNYGFKLDEWKAYYPNAKVDVTVNVKIKETGIRQ
ncbi:Ger(x)C family spore germination protein [Halalkalibacter oceani]|uniref:Ger(X)C family spore germination protein n=1 Tax=Halalkalibacter oceani TaxID=1653776 RepID=A0A9X2DLH8_9BACI|nr:Ger(x)C family spore germination protein [Halalkalibacter oceani]MCM3712946.1 Ger(x)C family spore germination protein [Halalkalibacter oceani]